MAVVLTNNATSLLAAAIDADDTTLSVLTADAGRFPNPAAGDWFPLTLVDNAGNMEIVKATARAGAIITVSRAQEGTTAKAFAAGARVDLRATAAALNDVGEKATTATVGAAVAGANGGDSIADGDTLTGVLSGTSSLRRWTWGNIKAWLKAYFDPIYQKTLGFTPVRQGGFSGATASTVSIGWGPGNLVLNVDATNFAENWPISIRGRANGGASWADGATYADRLGPGGWTLATVQDQLNWRVTDTRFDGYFSQELRTTGSATNSAMGSSGYVATAFSKRNVEVVDVAFRQPQRYIPNQGWRAIGGW